MEELTEIYEDNVRLENNQREQRLAEMDPVAGQQWSGGGEGGKCVGCLREIRKLRSKIWRTAGKKIT
jgi:hypothetical protein